MLIDEYIASTLDDVDSSYDTFSRTFSRSSTHNSIMSLENRVNPETSDLGSDFDNEKESSEFTQQEGLQTDGNEKERLHLNDEINTYDQPTLDSSQCLIPERDTDQVMHEEKTQKELKNGIVMRGEEVLGTTSKRNGSNLMALLCGSQDLQRVKGKKKVKGSSGEDNSVSVAPSSPFDKSFDESNAFIFKKEFDVVELERKVFNESMKSVSASDFLGSFKQKAKSFFVTLPVSSLQRDRIENDRSTQQNNGRAKIENVSKNNDNDNDDNDIEILESRAFGSGAKRTSARDLLGSFKPRSVKKDESKSSSGTLIVTLKLPTNALKEIKKYENPLKSRGNASYFSSISDSRVSSDSPSGRSESNFKALFKNMMDASKTATKHSAQMLKTLDPPILKRFQLHVIPPEEDLNHSDDFLRDMTPRKYKEVVCNMDEQLDFEIDKAQERNNGISIVSRKEGLEELVLAKIPNVTEISQLDYVYQKFILHRQKASQTLWSDLFQPKAVSEVLISTHNQELIKGWLTESFEKLKNLPPKKSRGGSLRQRNKNRNTSGEYDSFIVDDDYDFLEDIPTDDEFSPILVLKGSTGTCKSASIYAAAKEMNGYVFEINSGHSRGRKDILNNLKEFATTQLVHKQEESKQFQKGLILFEDVNILFEEDKKFWSVVYELMSVSRRPIILTCEHVLNFPKHILDVAEREESFVDLNSEAPDRNIMISFLWLCCVSQGYDLTINVLDEIIASCTTDGICDIRKSLIGCQSLCQRSTNEELVTLSFQENGNCEAMDGSCESVLDMAVGLDTLSCSDIISSGSFSVLEHEHLENEFSDVRYIHDSSFLRQPLLPHENNIGSELEELTRMKRYQPLALYSFNDAKKVVASFVGSRSKKIPKLMEDIYYFAPNHSSRLTRSSVSPATVLYGTKDWIPDTTGISEGSFIHSLSPNSLYSELAVFSRIWLRFQMALNTVERENMEARGISVKKVLGYRDFQTEPVSLLQTLNYAELYSFLNSV